MSILIVQYILRIEMILRKSFLLYVAPLEKLFGARVCVCVCVCVCVEIILLKYWKFS